MNCYIHCADVWCEDCTYEIKLQIAAKIYDNDARTGIAEFIGNEDFATPEHLVGIFDEVDERHYDSGEYPKGPYSDQESDCPEHCAGCGVFLENPLTIDGDDYVKETVRLDLETGFDDSVAVAEWMPFYDYIDYGPEDFCANCGDWTDLDDNDECENCADKGVCVVCGREFDVYDLDGDDKCPQCAEDTKQVTFQHPHGV